ncbi:MAG TPA: response regulator [Verrucomicrobiae bacterium]|nr:response regulator [Verrucomicrobiae bacterium]
MSKPLKILIVEDSQDDADLIVAELKYAGFTPQWKRVETERAFLEELKQAPDIILSDYSLPQFSGLKAATLLRASGLEIPFILISGTVGEDVAVEAMKHGATDYLLKDRIARLGTAVEQALEQKRLRDERKRSDEEIRNQLQELQRWHEAMLGREDRVLDLKKEVNELLTRQNLPPRYPEIP